MRNFDYSKIKEMTWDGEIVSLLSKIHEYKGKQELYLAQQPATLERLIEIAKIQSIEDSNKIEGIITTSTRIKELVAKKTTPKNRDEEEIMGYRDVLNTIHENFEYIPLSKTYILQLHRDLYKYSAKSIGGNFKNVQNTIVERKSDGSEVEKFKPLSPFETPSAIDNICHSYDKQIREEVIEPLLLIPIFIHDFLCIHPFNDGNGRMSRLLTTLLLYRAGYVVGRYISLESKIEKTKMEYYRTLDVSGDGWHEEDEDVVPFIKYLLRIILAAYRDFEDRVTLVKDKSNALEQVKHAVDVKLGKFTKSELLELLPMVAKSTLESSLKKLADEGYIEKLGSGRSTFYVKVHK